MKKFRKVGHLGIVEGSDTPLERGQPFEATPEAPLQMVGTCQAMRLVFQLIRRVATTDIPVLIAGATGTGKEMVAQAVHQRSPRAAGPFVVVNCGAIPRELLESEFFGHERGSFTGAHRTVVGKVELAQGGTLFLDEIGELPLELQVKLLRFLQDYSFERVGGREKRTADVRVISATNGNLKEMISQNRFREDLFYRLDGINIDLPPLAERGDDISIMATFFLTRYARDLGKGIKGFSPEAARALKTYSWPGNIRELINRVRRGVVMAEGPLVTPQNLDLESQVIKEDLGEGLGLKEALAQFEARLVTETLTRCHGNVQLTAQALKTSRSVVYHLINKHRLSLPEDRNN